MGRVERKFRRRKHAVDRFMLWLVAGSFFAMGASLAAFSGS